MNRYHIFHDGKLFAAVEVLPQITLETTPIGAYIHSHRGRWYKVMPDNLGNPMDAYIETHLVPNEYRVLMLIIK